MSSEVWKEITDIGDETSYFGFAPYDTPTDEAGWLIKRVIRINLDSTEQYSGDRPNAIWDNRTSISYV